jgi:hypothetical protein
MGGDPTDGLVVMVYGSDPSNTMLKIRPEVGSAVDRAFCTAFRISA